MKTHRVDIRDPAARSMRFAVTVDGIVRYVGSQPECDQRAAIFVPKTIAPAGPSLAALGASEPLTINGNPASERAGLPLPRRCRNCLRKVKRPPQNGAAVKFVEDSRGIAHLDRAVDCMYGVGERPHDWR